MGLRARAANLEQLSVNLPYVMLKSILSRIVAKPVSASGDVASYNRATHRIVPRGASVYDPKVFGKYDLENQKIVAKEEASGNFDLDVIVPLAQRHRSVVDYRLDCDRINLSYQFIPSGSGMLLDACSPIVNEPKHSLQRLDTLIPAIMFYYERPKITEVFEYRRQSL
ncbi:MAG: hypothetical protein AAF387_21815, partial [Pseudomonadota bacterium]